MSDVAVAHELKKGSLVLRPVLGRAVGLPDLRTRSKPRLVRVGYVADFIEEKRKVGEFRKAGELADPIFADIDQALHSGFGEESEELFGRLSGKSDSANSDIHSRYQGSSWLGSARNAHFSAWAM